MATLYELTDELSSLLEAIEAGEIPEEAIEDTLESVSGEFDEKCDNIACAIKNMRAEAAVIRAEEENLFERRRRKEREADRLSEYLSSALLKLGKRKLETARNCISFRTSNAVRLTDETAFIEWAEKFAPDAVNVTVTKRPCLSKIKELSSSVNLPHTVIEERQNIQIK